jgi:hypothetical protein
MYFPYLRGRQYELLALCELVDSQRIGNHIIPIIEPVKPSSTLTKTLNLFIQNEKEIAKPSGDLISERIPVWRQGG